MTPAVGVRPRGAGGVSAGPARCYIGSARPHRAQCFYFLSLVLTCTRVRISSHLTSSVSSVPITIYTSRLSSHLASSVSIVPRYNLHVPIFISSHRSLPYPVSRIRILVSWLLVTPILMFSPGISVSRMCSITVCPLSPVPRPLSPVPRIDIYIPLYISRHPPPTIRHSRPARA